MNKFEMTGTAGITQTVVSADTAKTLGSVITFDSTKHTIGVIISCETYDVRFTFNVAPTTSLGHLLSATQSVQFNNGETAKQFRFISASAGSHGTLMVTPLYKY